MNEPDRHDRFAVAPSAASSMMRQATPSSMLMQQVSTSRLQAGNLQHRRVRMLSNNRGPDVAEKTGELVVYGSIGRAARELRQTSWPIAISRCCGHEYRNYAG